MVQVHGHRGARAIYPENTLPGFEYAIECGVDALELDLAVTRDGVLVVSHDPAMNPVFCDGPADLPRVIREMTFAELREWDCGARPNPAFPRQQPIPGTRIPAFSEVLELAKRGDFDFNVETKIFANRPELTPGPDEFAWMIYQAAAGRGLLDRLILQSFDFRTLLAMRSLTQASECVRLSALFDTGSADIVDRAREAGAHIVSPHLSLVDARMVGEAHACGMAVVPWTANVPEHWQRLAAAGVDGMITDDPAALIAYSQNRD